MIHFRGVTLIYTARGLYFPKDFPKFANEKYQTGLISRGLCYPGPWAGQCGDPLSQAPQGSPGCKPLQPAEGCGTRSVGIGIPGVYLLALIPSGRLSVMHLAPTFKSCGSLLAGRSDLKVSTPINSFSTKGHPRDSLLPLPKWSSGSGRNEVTVH